MPVEEIPTLLQSARSKVRAIPADKVCKPIMAITYSLSLLAVAFLILTTGARGITDNITGHLHEAKDNLAALQGRIDYEVRMRYKFEWLTGLELPRRTWESHTECLVRGIHYVDAYFLGNGFYVDHADVTEATIGWVKDNCDRLAFTPQVVTPMKELSLARGWAFVNHHIADFLDSLKMKVLNPMVEPMKSSIGAFLGRVFSDLRQPYQNQNPGIVIEGDGSRAAATYRHWNLPPHFRLIDCENPTCKLVYEPPVNDISTSTPPKEALTKAEGQITALYNAAMTLWRIYITIDYLWRMTLVFQCLLMTTLIAIECMRPEVEYPPFPFFQPGQWLSWGPKFEEHDKRFWASIAFETILLVSIHYGSRLYDGLPLDFYVCSSIVGGLLLVLWLTTWVDSVPNITHIFHSLKDLSTAKQVTNVEAPTSSGALRSPPSPISTSSSLLTNVAGRVSSATSLVEDLDAIRAEEKADQVLQSTLNEIVNNEGPPQAGKMPVRFWGLGDIDFKSVWDTGSDWSFSDWSADSPI